MNKPYDSILDQAALINSLNQQETDKTDNKQDGFTERRDHQAPEFIPPSTFQMYLYRLSWSLEAAVPSTQRQTTTR